MRTGHGASTWSISYSGATLSAKVLRSRLQVEYVVLELSDDLIYTYSSGSWDAGVALPTGC